MKIAIIPTQDKFTKDNIFDIANCRDNALERFVLLKQVLENKGHICHTIDMFRQRDVDILIFFDFQVGEVLHVIKRNPNVKIIYNAIESSHICSLHITKILGQLPSDLLLTWNDKAVEMFSHTKKCNIGEPYINIESIPYKIFGEKKFCCMIISNKSNNTKNELYSERLNAIRFFAQKTEDFDLFGTGWGSSTDPLVKKVYKGPVASKKDTMQYYKFAICYENIKDEMGYITEKIFDCFAAGCVPVYYGASNVTDYIPKECFIDFRHFSDYKELYSFMMNMEKKEYNEYLKAVKKFLQTDAYKEFTSEAYVRNILQAIEELKGKKVNRNFYKVKLDLMCHVIKNIRFYIKNLKRTRRFIYDVVTVW